MDLERLLKGLQDSLANVPPALDAARRDAIYQEIRDRQTQAEAARAADVEAESASNLVRAEAFLQDNATAEGVQVTDSGLQYRVLVEQSGPNAGADARVVVHYKGSFPNGEIFDQSQEAPAEFNLNQVIPGWTEGLQLMSVGEERRFWIPQELASNGRPGAPAGMLVFDVELLEIKASAQ